MMLCAAAGPCLAAAPAERPAGSAVIVVTGASGHAARLAPAALRRLPSERVTVSFGTDHGRRHGTFTGPLLWTVLAREGAIDPAQPRAAVRETVLITGSDGYSAALALGEIAPAFEAKHVIVADQADGRLLGPGHFRLVVPGDRYGGRSVRDVVRIAVIAPESEQR